MERAARLEELCLHPFLPAAVLAGGLPCLQRELRAETGNAEL